MLISRERKLFIKGGGDFIKLPSIFTPSMHKTRKIAVNLFLLSISIFLIGVNALQDIFQSIKERKGDILSVIFSFLADITEEIFVFEKSILSRSWMLQQKFIKRGLVIGAAFFVLLSSFQKSNDGQEVLSAGAETVQAFQEQIIITVNNNDQSIDAPIIANPGFIKVERESVTQQHLYRQVYFPPKKYLTNRSFLI